MHPITPETAAGIASDVYSLRLSEDVSKIGRALPDWAHQFEPPQRFTGTSGAILRARTGFGFIARGTGPRKRQALIAVRGTASSADFATDGHCGWQIGPGGLPVHAGFNTTFASFRESLDRFFRDSAREPIEQVHCVGHSLGGALATLVADYVSDRGMETALYTFGSPRAGLATFSWSLTGRLAPENIHRVYHINDPVSMLPLFPFLHVPCRGDVIELPDSYSMYNAASHGMRGYMGDVYRRQWRDLRCQSTNWLIRLDDTVKEWLTSEGRSSITRLGGITLWFLTRALLHLIKLALDVVGAGLQTLLSSTLTLLDLLAYLLRQAAIVSERIGKALGAVVSETMRLLGRTVDGARDVTAALLRYVVGLLLGGLLIAAERALAMVEGGILL